MNKVRALTLFPFAAITLCGCGNSNGSYFSIPMDNTIWTIELSSTAAKALKEGFVLDAPASRSTINGFSCSNATISFGVNQTENMRKDISSDAYQAEYQPIIRINKESEGYSRKLRGNKAVSQFTPDSSMTKLYGKDEVVLVEAPLEKPLGSLLWSDPSPIVSSLQEGKGEYENGGFAWKIGYHSDSLIILESSKSETENGNSTHYESLWFFYRDEQSKWRVGRTHEEVTYSNSSRFLTRYRQTEYSYHALSPTPTNQATLAEEDFCGYVFDASRLYLAPLATTGTILTEGLKNLGIPHPFEESVVFSPSFSDSAYDVEDQKININEQTIGLTGEGELVSVWDFLGHF